MTPTPQPRPNPGDPRAPRYGASRDAAGASGLIDLLDQQRRIYLKLQDLGRTQSQLVAAGDAEPLLELLGQRQLLIDHLSQINSSIEPYKKSWPVVWGSLDEPSRVRVQGLIDHVQNLLDQIVEQDSKDRAALTVHRERIADDLGQLRRGSNVNRAYGRRDTGPDSRNRYTDEQG
jgi:hypothetical protein